MQDHWQYFTKRRLDNTLPHAVLFTGQDSQEKLKFVLDLAEFLLCNKITIENPKACGNCRSCQLFNAKAHPDYYYISPEEKSKVITIAQIRDLSAALMRTAQLNYYKLAIITPAHAMNSAASNALLKTLEEPPGLVIIILITDKPEVLPRTIYSRCQVINFKSLDILDNIINPNIINNIITNKNYDPVYLAKFCLDFDLEIILNNIINIILDYIKNNLNKLNQNFYYYYDKVLYIKKYTRRRDLYYHNTA